MKIKIALKICRIMELSAANYLLHYNDAERTKFIGRSRHKYLFFPVINPPKIKKVLDF